MTHKARRQQTHHHNRASRAPKHWDTSASVPWPTLGDGTPFMPDEKADRLVSHRDLPAERGTIQWVEWCHPGGGYMQSGDRSTKGGKTTAPRPRDGEWWAVVSWQAHDRHEALKSKCAMANLLPVEPKP